MQSLQEVEDQKETVRVALVKHLMMHAGVIDKADGNIEQSPHFKKFANQAEKTIKFLGSEDYLSLVAALDRDDTVTILRLLRKANDNAAKDATLGELAMISRAERALLERAGYVYFLRYGSSGHQIYPILDEMRLSYLPVRGGIAIRATDGEAAQITSRLKKSQLAEVMTPFRLFGVKFVPKIGGDDLRVITEAPNPQDAANRAIRWFSRQSKYDIKNYDVAIDDRNTGRPIAVLRDKTMKQTASKQGVTETVLGMAKVPGLSRLRELAGLDLAPTFPAGEVSFSSEPEIEMSDPPPMGPPPPPPPPPREMKPDTSDAFQSALDHVEQAKELVYDMRITEYRLFCDRAEEFCSAVKAMGSQFFDER